MDHFSIVKRLHSLVPSEENYLQLYLSIIVIVITFILQKEVIW